jgi:hypothetical protein
MLARNPLARSYLEHILIAVRSCTGGLALSPCDRPAAALVSQFADPRPPKDRSKGLVAAAVGRRGSPPAMQLTVKPACARHQLHRA